MRHIKVCIWMLLLYTHPYAVLCQNLVPNPDFELFNNCPGGISAISFSPTYTSFPSVRNWVNPLKYTSPDYFNACAGSSTGVQVPLNTFGYQRANSGKAYAGLILWEESTTPGNTYSFGEYLETRLTAPMDAGREYCVSFNVSPAISPALTFNYMAMDEIGIHFSNAQVSHATGDFLSLSYDIVNTPGRYLTDTSGWIKVTGLYKAKGGEEWLTLGRFNTGLPANVLVSPPTPNPAFPYRTYVYIDDVNVYRVNNIDTVTNTHDSTYCSSSSLPMHLQTNNTDGNFLWSDGSVTPGITVSADGVYWCRNLADCKVYLDTFIVRQDPDTKLNLGKELVSCDNTPVVIKANHTYDRYKWSTGDTTSSITVNAPGTYWLRVTNFCGFQADTVRVYIQPPTPQPVARDTMVCQFSPSPVFNNIPGNHLMWYTHALSTIGSPLQPYIYTGEVTQYILYVTQTIDKCESKKTAIKVDVKYTPKRELENNISMCRHDPILIGNEHPGVEYYWNTGDRVCCIKPRREGHFFVTKSNECGTYTDSTLVKFEVCEDCIAVPNAFTPDGDDVNDKFTVFQTCPINGFHMRIFDRWGKQVFESFDVGKSWTGTIEGRYLEAGVYVYYIEYTPDATHIKKILKGSIHLIR